jgi:alpha-N-arabinofuranosidase
MMYKPHRDATALPFELERGEYERDGESLPAVSATASRDAEGRVHISLTNIDPNEARVVEIELDGVSAPKVRSAHILVADEMNARNTFDAPDALQPQSFSGYKASGKRLRVTLPAKSLVTLAL